MLFNTIAGAENLQPESLTFDKILDTAAQVHRTL